MTEIWKPIPSTSGTYEASSLGKIRRVLLRGQPCEPRLMVTGKYGKSPYLQVCLCVNAKQRTAHVHRLICEAFHGERDRSFHARHINGNPNDNRSENLAWGMPSENMADQYKHGTRAIGARSGNAKLTDEKVKMIFSLREQGQTQTEIAVAVGVSQTTVWHVLKGLQWKHVERKAA